MTGRIVGSGSSTRYFVDGEQVTKERFDELFPPKPIGDGSGLIAWHKPVLSDALAVHPRQIPEAMERDRAHGVPTEYLPDGRPIVTSAAHKRKLMKSFEGAGMHENNCFN